MSIKVVNSGAGKNITLDGNEIDGNNINLKLNPKGYIKEFTRRTSDSKTIYDIADAYYDDITDSILIIAENDVNYSSMYLYAIKLTDFRKGLPDTWSQKQILLPVTGGPGCIFKRNNGDLITFVQGGNSATINNISKISKDYTSNTLIESNSGIFSNVYIQYFLYDKINDKLHFYETYNKIEIIYDFKNKSFTKSTLPENTGIDLGISCNIENKIYTVLSENIIRIYDIYTKELTNGTHNIKGDNIQTFKFRDTIYAISTQTLENTGTKYGELYGEKNKITHEYEKISIIQDIDSRYDTYSKSTETESSILIFDLNKYNYNGYIDHYNFELPFFYELEVK